MAIALSNETYKQLSGSLHIPLYERSKLKPAIVHLGVGNFHRSHFCYYLEQLLNGGHTDWGIEEVDLLLSDTKERAEGQDFLYSLIAKDSSKAEELSVIGCICGYTQGWKEKEKVVALIAAQSTQLITLTITEKGYCYDERTQGLDFGHPEIINDLMHPNDPTSAIGFLCLGLQKRFETSRQDVTIASCDNLPSNSKKLQRCILDYCKQVFPSSLAWIEACISFPCSMVDRITPRTTEDDRQYLRQNYGFHDDWAVVSEQFLMWVIEPKGVFSYLDFSIAGAIISEQVEAYEEMKIRLLNSSHSALAYPAYLLLYTYVDEAMYDTRISRFIIDVYMDYISSTLSPIKTVSFEEYKDQLIDRFANPNIRDTILRLAQDGSKKFATSLIPALSEAVDHGLAYQTMLLALAFWAQFLVFTKAELIDDQQKKILKTLLAKGSYDSFLVSLGLPEAQATTIREEFSDLCLFVENSDVGTCLTHYTLDERS